MGPTLLRPDGRSPVQPAGRDRGRARRKGPPNGQPYAGEADLMTITRSVSWSVCASGSV